jgi:hypothetical protein
MNCVLEYETTTSGVKQYGKRLETVDGVEIASSYKEYLDLALGDLKDRLRKSKTRSDHFKGRIIKRTILLNDIKSEIKKREEYSKDLLEKDKILRNRLIRNTEMKSALQNLADIAGYKLDTLNNLRKNQNNISFLNFTEKQNFTNLLLNRFESDNKSNTNSYTRYIEMAYSEVDQILVSDKQALIEIIRKLKTNKFKLIELETLKAKVNSSLIRLNEFEYKLLNIIKHDAQIQDTISKLENEINYNLLSLNNNLVKNNLTINRNNVLLSHFV